MIKTSDWSTWDSNLRRQTQTQSPVHRHYVTALECTQLCPSFVWSCVKLGITTHSVGSLFLYGALDSHPFVPSHVASGRCVLSAAAAGAPAGVVSAFAEPRRWCAAAVRVVAGCAVCASAAPSSRRIGVDKDKNRHDNTYTPPPPPGTTVPPPPGGDGHHTTIT